MKLSENTLNVLKNFAGINSGLVLLPGKKQRTTTEGSTILAEAELDEEFDTKFGIYDLNQFLGNVTTMNSPDLVFHKDKFITMTDDSMSLNYFGCDTDMVTAPKEDVQIELNKPDVSFVLTNTMLTKLLRVATMNKLPHISFIGIDGEIRVKAHERKNDTSNFAFSKVADYKGKPFTITFKCSNLLMLPDDYEVDVNLAGFARFTAKNKKIKYFIAMEA